MQESRKVEIVLTEFTRRVVHTNSYYFELFSCFVNLFQQRRQCLVQLYTPVTPLCCEQQAKEFAV